MVILWSILTRTTSWQLSNTVFGKEGPVLLSYSYDHPRHSKSASVRKRPGRYHPVRLCQSIWQSIPSKTTIQTRILRSQRTYTTMDWVFPWPQKTACAIGLVQIFPSRCYFWCTTGHSVRPFTLLGLHQWSAWSCQPLWLPPLCRWLSLIQTCQIRCWCKETARRPRGTRKVGKDVAYEVPPWEMPGH